ncbi:MAG: PspA/IM30 family protein, partial [Myxococcota bacterium]
SNINSLLDKAEDPEKSLDLTLQEMTESLAAAKKEIVSALGTQKLLAKKVDEQDTEVEKWERRAELALKSDDEDLAREALKQKKRVIAERDRAEAQRAEQRGVVLNMKREMERMEAKVEELKARKSTIVRDMKRAKDDDPMATRGPGGKAFEEFRRMEEKIEHAHAEGAAMAEVDAVLQDGLSATELEAKFAALEGRGYTEQSGPDDKPSAADPIDDEIARLKNKMRIGD